MRLDSEVIAIKERSSMLALAYGRLDVGVPRARGDEPAPIQPQSAGLLCSPHPRG